MRVICAPIAKRSKFVEAYFILNWSIFLALFGYFQQVGNMRIFSQPNRQFCCFILDSMVYLSTESRKMKFYILNSTWSNPWTWFTHCTKWNKMKHLHIFAGYTLVCFVKHKTSYLSFSLTPKTWLILLLQVFFMDNPWRLHSNA